MLSIQVKHACEYAPFKPLRSEDHMQAVYLASLVTSKHDYSKLAPGSFIDCMERKHARWPREVSYRVWNLLLSPTA